MFKPWRAQIVFKSTAGVKWTVCAGRPDVRSHLESAICFDVCGVIFVCLEAGIYHFLGSWKFCVIDVVYLYSILRESLHIDGLPRLNSSNAIKIESLVSVKCRSCARRRELAKAAIDFIIYVFLRFRNEIMHLQLFHLCRKNYVDVNTKIACGRWRELCSVAVFL